MAEIRKFKGFRFAPDRVNMAKVTAPPYDVFDYGDDLDKNLRRAEEGVVHIQKPEGEGDAKYTHALEVFRDRVDRGILQQDEESYYYIYQQTVNGMVRTGIIAAVKLDDTYTIVKRHEKTKEGPKVDRLKLTKATGLNIGLVFTVFKDADGSVYDILKKITEQEEPVYSFEFPAGIDNKLWLTRDDRLSELVQDKNLYIADGHHRYQTMVDYRNHLREKYNTGAGDDKPYEYAMIFNVPAVNLTILPYNRVVHNIAGERFAGFLEKIAEKFVVTELPGDTIYNPAEKREIGMYFAGKSYRLQPKPGIIDDDDVVGKLDVSILQNHILKPILGIDDEKLKSGKYITYPKGEADLSEIKDLVDNKQHQVGFTLYPTLIEELMDVSDNNQVMPQKSTYFFPKLLTGMVLYQSEKK